MAWRRNADVARCTDSRLVRHCPRRWCRGGTIAALVVADRLGRSRDDTRNDRRRLGACDRPGTHSLSRAQPGRRRAPGDVSYDLARLGIDSLQQRRAHRQRHGHRQRRTHSERRGRSHHLRKCAAGFQQARAHRARLDHHRHLPRGDDRRRRVLVPARPAGHGLRVFSRQPRDSVLGGGRQSVRDQYQLDQLSRDSRQGVRDGLAVHDEQAHDRFSV